MHLNTLINEGSSSETLFALFVYTNQHFVVESLLLHILLFFVRSSTSSSCFASVQKAIRIPWCEEDGQSELNLHVTC